MDWAVLDSSMFAYCTRRPSSCPSTNPSPHSMDTAFFDGTLANSFSGSRRPPSFRPCGGALDQEDSYMLENKADRPNRRLSLEERMGF